jgi:hypothetical protein
LSIHFAAISGRLSTFVTLIAVTVSLEAADGAAVCSVSVGLDCTLLPIPKNWKFQDPHCRGREIE